ncbi:hypothetical protein L208DRAFT_1561941 [Tricholoma matsutake]|nr:hypothetical protein L208DRAFT_1561941 [Tricholoma matsutake 945]
MFLSQMFFQRDQLLAQIDKEPEFSEVDRSIGNFKLPEEWEEWKAGPGQPKDEYDLEEEDSKEKHEDLDCGSDGNSEPEAENFMYQINVSSKTKDTQKVFAVSSKTNWVDLEQKIAGTLNFFAANVHVQYVLSTEPAGAIPIALALQTDLAELHGHLVPLVVPPQNANGSVSKQKMKEVIVRVTDKADDVAPSAASNRKKRSESQEQLRGLPFGRQSEPTGDVKPILLETELCHAGRMEVLCITENDLNLWAKLHCIPDNKHCYPHPNSKALGQVTVWNTVPYELVNVKESLIEQFVVKCAQLGSRAFWVVITVHHLIPES